MAEPTLGHRISRFVYQCGPDDLADVLSAVKEQAQRLYPDEVWSGLLIDSRTLLNLSCSEQMTVETIAIAKGESHALR